MRKKISISLLILVILAAAGVLLLPVIVDVNQYRGLIQDKAQEALGRKVTLGEMKLKVLPTFGINVQEPAVEGLLEARSVTVGARILPLLFGGSVELTKVILDRPVITLTRRPDGTWDAQDLAGPEPQPGSPAAPPRPFSLARLKISGGLLHLRGIGPDGSSDIDVNLDLDGSLERDESGAMDVALRAGLVTEGVEVTGAGELESSAGGMRAAFEIDRAQVDLDRARKIVSGAGVSWPLPEGLITSRAITVRGKGKLRTGNGGLEMVSLDGIRLEGVEATLSRNRKGEWNFAALTDGKPAAPAGGPAAPGPALDLTVRDLEVAGAVLRLIDQPEGIDLTLDELKLSLEELSGDRPLSLTASARLASGGRLSVSGVLPVMADGSLGSKVDARVEIDRLDVASIAPYLREAIALPEPTGTVSLQGTFAGDYPGAVRGKGTLGLDGVTVAQAARPVSATAEFDATARDSAALMELHRLQARYEKSVVEMTGTIDNRGKHTRVDLTIPPASVEAKDLLGLAALSGSVLPVEFDATSPVRLEARIRGEVREGAPLDLTGSIEVSGATFRHPTMSQPMREVSGKISVEKDAFEVTGFSGVIGDSDVAGSLSVADLDSPRVTFDLRSRRADFWELMSFLNEEEAPAGGGAASPSAPEDDILGRVAANGTLAIGEGAFNTLEFQDLSATVRLRDKVLTLEPVEMKLYGGTMKGSASMDMGRAVPLYAVKAQADGIDTDALLAANLDMKETLAGALSGHLEVAASGQSQEQALEAATGGGRISLADGRVGAINVLKALTRASDVLGEKSLQKVSDKLARQGTEFSSMTATLAVRGGVVSSEDLHLVSPDLELKGEGGLDMLAGTLDMSANIVFSDPLTRAMVEEKSKAADYFWDSSLQRVNLPLKLSGPIEAPMPNIDWQTAGGQLARRKIQDAVQGRLEKAGLGDLLKPKQEAAPAAPVAPSSTPVPETEPEAPPGNPGISISRSKLSGNFLLPDLKVKGTLSGTDIQSAVLVVRNSKGDVIHEVSLMETVRAHYASADPSQPARIDFSIEVDGKKLVGARSGLEITIEVTDGSGRTGKKTFEASR